MTAQHWGLQSCVIQVSLLVDSSAFVFALSAYFCGIAMPSYAHSLNGKTLVINWYIAVAINGTKSCYKVGVKLNSLIYNI